MISSRYFKKPHQLQSESTPQPLICSIWRTSRFNEIDPLNIVWHGHYASYFEDARVAFGDHYGLSYQALHKIGFVIPIKQIYIDYVLPIHFNEKCKITAMLFWNDGARLDFEYNIETVDGVLLAQGYTVQVFLNDKNEICYAKPDFYEEFCEKWRDGLLPQQSHRL